MTIIDGTASTQLPALNILDRFFIRNVEVLPGGGQDIRILSGTQTQQIDDDIIIITGGAFTLIKASTGIKQIVIKSKLGGGGTEISPFAGDTINLAANLSLGAGTSTVLAPIASGTDWEIIG